MGGPDMAPQTPQRSEHPCSAVGAPRYPDRLLALRARFFDVEHLRHRLRRVAQLEPVDTFQPIEDRLDAPSGLEDLFDPPASGGVHLLSEQLRLAHDDGQRIVDLVRGRSGEARDIPEGVALPDGRLGLLSVGDVTSDRRRADDLPSASRVGETGRDTSIRPPSFLTLTAS